MSVIGAPEVRAFLERSARVLDLPDDFLVALLLDDDWSFTVKANALLESAIAAFLTAHIADARMLDVITEDITMAQRIKMLSALDLLTSKQRGVLWALNRLRNKLAHNANQTRFRFSEHLRAADAKARFLESFGLSWPERVPVPGGEPIPRDHYVLANPKYAVWSDVVQIVAVCAGKAGKFKLEQLLAERDALQEQLASAARHEDQ